jgi:nitrous oxidase accessory protein NosD
VYVDFENGREANSGHSPASAWKYCPGDERARGKHSLSGEDTVFFKGGAVYKGTITISTSGTNTKRTVYDGNSSGSWGHGRAIIDGENLRYYGFFSDDSKLSEVLIRHFEIRNMRYNKAAPWMSGAGIYIENGRKLSIDSCSIHDNGYWNNDGSVVPAGYGVVLKNPTGCTVSGCEITKTGGSGIWCDGAQECVIARNDIHHFVNWGIDLSGSARKCRNNAIRSNVIHDLFQYDRGFWKGVGDPPHQDFIFIRKADGTRPAGNIVENNLFFNDYLFTDFGGTAMLFLSYADSTIVRNNTFINAHSYSAAYFGWTSRQTSFVNNTVFCLRTGGVRLGTGGDTRIAGNVFAVQKSAITFDSTLDEERLLIDSNAYWFSENDSPQSFARASPYKAWSFGEWQGTGRDRGGVLYLSVTDIGFIDVSGYPLGCRNMNLRRRM